MTPDFTAAAKASSVALSFATAVTLGVTNTLIQTSSPGETFNALEWGGQVVGIGALLALLSTGLIKLASRFFTATDDAQQRLADENTELRQENKELRSELTQRLLGKENE
jgi:hypothetical protein